MKRSTPVKNAEWTTAPQPLQNIDAFIEQFDANLAINSLAKARKAQILSCAQAEWENKAALGELVKCGCFTGQLPGTAA